MVKCSRCEKEFMNNRSLSNHKRICDPPVRDIKDIKRFGYRIKTLDGLHYYLGKVSQRVNYINMNKSNESYFTSILNHISEREFKNITSADVIINEFISNIRGSKSQSILSKQYWLSYGWELDDVRVSNFIYKRQSRKLEESDKFWLYNNDYILSSTIDITYSYIPDYLKYIEPLIDTNLAKVKKVSSSVKLVDSLSSILETKNPVYHLNQNDNIKYLNELISLFPFENYEHKTELVKFIKLDIEKKDITCRCGDKKRWLGPVKLWAVSCHKSECLKPSISEKNIKRWGTSNPRNSEEIKEKIKSNNLLKYGQESHMTEEVKKKISDKHLNKTEEEKLIIKNKTIQTGLINHLNKTLLSRLESLNLTYVSYEDRNYTLHCNDCDKNFLIDLEHFSDRFRKGYKVCLNCNPKFHMTSQPELEIKSFIERNYSGLVLGSDRNQIHPYELDIYLPELNIAIEYNGSYWHTGDKKGEDYHWIKYKMTKDKGIDLLQIHEEYYNTNKRYYENKIMNMLGHKDILLENLSFKIKKNRNIKFLTDNYFLTDIEFDSIIECYYKKETVSLLIIKDGVCTNIINKIGYCVDYLKILKDNKIDKYHLHNDLPNNHINESTYTELPYEKIIEFRFGEWIYDSGKKLVNIK